MGKIIISPYVKLRLDELTEILYKDDYFGFFESSQIYVGKMIDFIYSIPNLRRRKTRNPKHGRYYAHYKVNKKTQYYFTYNVLEDVYFIENIFSNHESGYATYVIGNE